MADNSAGFEALDAQQEKLRQLGDINSAATPEVAREFEGKVVSNVAAQLDPYGHPWHPSPDGLPLLVNAAQHVTSEARGTTVTMTVSGVENRHHVGSAKGYHGGSGAGYNKAGGESNLSRKALGGFRRPIIPFSKLPGPFKDICRTVLVKVHTRIMGGT